MSCVHKSIGVNSMFPSEHQYQNIIIVIIRVITIKKVFSNYVYGPLNHFFHEHSPSDFLNRFLQLLAGPKLYSSKLSVGANIRSS